MVPDWYELILLALASFRVWKLVGDDAVLDRPRDWVLDRLDREGDDVWTYFITCPWCAGFWITLLWWVAWLLVPYATLVAAALFAISALVGYLGVGIDKLESD